MRQNNAEIGVAYYKAMEAKDMGRLEKYLHPDIVFIGPLAEVKGKEAVLAAAKGFSSFLKKITIRSTFSSETQAMLAYDMDCPEPIGSFRAATLMNFQKGLIIKLELFYDAAPFQVKKEEIFS
ncbi:MAG: nuclear transport factor 2 family protein [Chlamydiota bacterium]